MILQVTRRALVSRVIPAVGELTANMVGIIFSTSALSNAKCSKPVNSFDEFVFYVSGPGLWLRFGVLKSENEFVAAALAPAKRVCP